MSLYLLIFLITAVQRYGSDLSVSAFLCRCTNDKCDYRIDYRIDYKLAVTAFRAKHGLAPDYINELALPHSVSRTLRSTGANLLHVPKSNIVKGDRAFLIAGPKVWNSLPSNIRAITNLVDFKKKLKTFFIGRLLCKAPVNLLETERSINFNIIIINIIY